jgi:Holliday junction resolvase
MKTETKINTRQKGRKLVREIVRRLKEEGLSCYEVVGSGAGLLKGDIRVESLDLVIEAKKHKQISMVSWVKQSEKEGLGINRTALAWQIPATPDIRIDVSLEYFIDLLLRAQGPKIKQVDREMRYKIQRAVDSLKALLKDF